MTTRFQKSSVRFLALLLASAVLIGGFSVSLSVLAEDSIDELTSQKDDLAVKQEELAAQRDETAASLEEQQAQSEIIREQIDTKSEEIAVSEQILSELDAKISDTEGQIAQKESTILALENEIGERYQTLRARLRAISKKSVLSSFIQFIFGDGTFTDYLIGFKMSARISAHDQAMMDQLEADMVSVEATKNKLKTDKAALEIERNQADAVRNDMEADKENLRQLYNESDAIAQEMAQDVNWLDEQIAETLAKQEALQNEIDAVLERIRAEEEAARKEAEENGEEYNDLIFTGNGDGTMLWPTPTCPVITSSFGWRDSTSSFHKGIDIACYGDAEGEPIVAAADGVVMYTAYEEWGYGNYMIVDHGDDSDGRRIFTVYAHCSSIVAYDGMEVEAGDLIGYVGDTGRSYGAHLHFEVNIDGVAVDPISNGYLSTDGIDVLG